MQNVRFWVKLQSRQAKITLWKGKNTFCWRKVRENLVISYNWLFDESQVTQYTTLARKVGEKWSITRKVAMCDLWGINKGVVSENEEFRFPRWVNLPQLGRTYSQTEAYQG
jgi:hypothetical protein